MTPLALAHETLNTCPITVKERELAVQFIDTEGLLLLSSSVVLDVLACRHSVLGKLMEPVQHVEDVLHGTVGSIGNLTVVTDAYEADYAKLPLLAEFAAIHVHEGKATAYKAFVP